MRMCWSPCQVPPAWAWYYQQIHPDYSAQNNRTKTVTEYMPMQFLYPTGNYAKVAIPDQWDGTPGIITLELVHDINDAVVYWHVDGNYFSSTKYTSYPTVKTYKVKVQFNPEVTELPENAVSYVYKFSVKYDQYKAPAAQTSPVSVTTENTTVPVGSTATVTVSFTAATWNLTVAGDVTETTGLTITGNNASNPIEDETVTRTFTVDTSTAGTKTITVTGDVTNAAGTETEINKTITVTVE